MAGAQHRRAETDDRAEAGSGARTLQPHEIATAFGQIANDLSLMAQRPDEPEAQSPSLEEPWDADAADELARLYASGDAGLAQPLSGDAELQLRLARTVAQAAALRPAPQMSGIDHVGIEARLVGLTRTIEAALARLGAGASGPSTTADAGGLKLIEAHAAELLAQAQETRTELGRLAGVEAQLGELKASLSEGRIAGFIEAVMPTEDELTRFAEAAAQKAIRGRREAAPDLAAAARLNERTGEIQRLLTGFIEEHRRNEHQAAEALETMQQAMQHILDRIDAIEAASIEALPETLQTKEHVSPRPGRRRPSALSRMPAYVLGWRLPRGVIWASAIVAAGSTPSRRASAIVAMLWPEPDWRPKPLLTKRISNLFRSSVLAQRARHPSTPTAVRRYVPASLWPPAWRPSCSRAIGSFRAQGSGSRMVRARSLQSSSILGRRRRPRRPHCDLHPQYRMGTVAGLAGARRQLADLIRRSSTQRRVGARSVEAKRPRRKRSAWRTEPRPLALRRSPTGGRRRPGGTRCKAPSAW